MLSVFAKTTSSNRSMRTKAIGIAIVLGTIPVLVTGAISYNSTTQSLTEQIFALKQSKAQELADKVNRFMFERLGDIQTISKVPNFTDPKVIKIISPQKQSQVLDNFMSVYRVYDTIAIFNLQGEIMVKSSKGNISNYANKELFQKVLQTDLPMISNPEVSEYTHDYVIYAASPLKNIDTGEPLGVAISEMPVKYLQELIRSSNNNEDNIHLIDAYGKIFLAPDPKFLGKKAQDEYAFFSEIQTIGKASIRIGLNQIDQKTFVVATAPTENIEGLALNWISLVDTDTKIAFATTEQLRLSIITGTIITILFVGTIATILSIFITEPLIQKILNAVNAIVSSSNQIVTTTEEQERAATQQVAAVNQTTTTMGELSTASQQCAQQAESVALGAETALNLAEKGNQTVTKTLGEIAILKTKVEAIADQISHLSQQTELIGSISELVKDLANQTNMLALNAAVEAVRAGEHGKGFAVVATEIRKLADESKKSAAKINALVMDIQKSIDLTVNVTNQGTETAVKGGEVAQATASAFLGVAEAINQVVLSSQQISLSAQQQAIAIQQVVETMNHLNSSAKETVAGITQIKLGTHSLNEVAKSLKTMV